MTEEPDLFTVDPVTHARSSDPGTSHAAAHALTDKQTMLRTLLRAYRDHGPMHADGATRAAGYTAQDGAWKRVSDLKGMGYIEHTGQTRPGASGRQQQVCAITDEGRRQLTL